MKKVILYILYWILSLTWGIIMTIIGAFAAFGLLISKHKPYRLGPNIYFKVGENWGGVNFGPFFITDSTPTDHTRMHEAGHGLQNILYGPLFPFIVAIPSATRYWYREYIWRHRRTEYWDLPDYDAIWFEGQATKWGTKIYSKIINEKKEG